MWNCAYCGHPMDERPGLICPQCGLVMCGLGTIEKYQILSEYCIPLSLILRNNNITHHFIDACAGSGYVQDYLTDSIIDGSPLIMAKTREAVQERIVDKTKSKQVQCHFIECYEKTYNVLCDSLSDFPEVRCYHGDTNAILPEIMESCSRTFAFVYIDPFGLGDPPIRYQTIEKVLERPRTEMFIHYSWEGVSRMAGQLKNIDHPDKLIRQTAQSTVESLDKFMTNQWQEIEARNLRPNQRRRAYLDLYERILKEYYDGVQYIEIPIGSNNPSYYLFFTTRNDTGHKIMGQILGKAKRKGSQSLDKWAR